MTASEALEFVENRRFHHVAVTLRDQTAFFGVVAGADGDNAVFFLVDKKKDVSIPLSEIESIEDSGNAKTLELRCPSCGNTDPEKIGVEAEGTLRCECGTRYFAYLPERVEVK